MESPSKVELSLTNSEIEKALSTAFRACDQASQILISKFGKLKHVSEKERAGLVSEADRESEVAIRDIVAKSFPSHSFLGEEWGLVESNTGSSEKVDRGATEGGAEAYDLHADPADRPSNEGLQSKWNAYKQSLEPMWVVDPLDGTNNYVHRFPLYCISIGLEVAGRTLLGVIDVPATGVRYHAIVGQGAFRLGQPITISNRSKMEEAMLVTGFSGFSTDVNKNLQVLKSTIERSRGVRRTGSAALDLCLVAEGVFDGFWERELRPWDTSAGTLIASEAGAVVTNFDGQPYQSSMRDVVCATPGIHKELIELLRVDRS